MKKEYLNDILSGKKKTDVRSYNTPVNGKIALINSKNGKVYGYAMIIGSKFITYKEYVLWHVNDDFTYNQALDYYEKTKNKKTFCLYYEYILSNIEVLESPIKPNVIFTKYSWVRIEN